MNSTDIIGWAYQADTWHSDCLPAPFAATYPESVTARVNAVAGERGYEEDDPYRKSTEHLPQPIFLDDLGGAGCCGNCGEPLID